MKERDDDSLHALSRLRRQDRDSPVLLNEYLEIKASIMLENSFARDNFPNLSGFKLHVAQVCYEFPLCSTSLTHFKSTCPSSQHGPDSGGWLLAAS